MNQTLVKIKNYMDKVHLNSKCRYILGKRKLKKIKSVSPQLELIH